MEMKRNEKGRSLIGYENIAYIDLFIGRSQKEGKCKIKE
jgi:hypothetical protein